MFHRHHVRDSFAGKFTSSRDDGARLAGPRCGSLDICRAKSPPRPAWKALGPPSVENEPFPADALRVRSAVHRQSRAHSGSHTITSSLSFSCNDAAFDGSKVNIGCGLASTGICDQRAGGCQRFASTSGRFVAHVERPPTAVAMVGGPERTADIRRSRLTSLPGAHSFLPASAE